MKIAILAAGRSSRIYNKIQKNKCLIEINGETLINNSIRKLIETNKIKEEDIYIVTGFNHKMLKLNIKKNLKKLILSTINIFKREMLYSMMLALKKIKKDFICIYSDILISQKTLNKLFLKKDKFRITIPILKNWEQFGNIKANLSFKMQKILSLMNVN